MAIKRAFFLSPLTHIYFFTSFIKKFQNIALYILKLMLNVSFYKYICMIIKIQKKSFQFITYNKKVK